MCSHHFTILGYNLQTRQGRQEQGEQRNVFFLQGRGTMEMDFYGQIYIRKITRELKGKSKYWKTKETKEIYKKVISEHKAVTLEHF